MLSLTELGQKLQQARKEKNISLDELQEVTKIQKRYLEAIENGEYEKLPGQFYARAFIKTYAEAVGLNPEELFNSYPSDTPKSDEPVLETLQRPQQTKRKLTDSTKFSFYFSKIIIALGAILIIGIVWFLLQSNSSTKEPVLNESKQSSVEVEKGDTTPEQKTTVVDDKEKKKEKDKEESVQKEVKKEETATSYEIVEETATDFIIEVEQEMSVSLSFSGETWMDIKNGLGKTFVAKMFNENETFEKDFSNEEEILIKFGYVPAAKLKVNGDEVSLPEEGSLYKVTIQKKAANLDEE
mgnify:CR=1 FL=1